MGYAIMITDKIKTIGTMTSKYNHNERIAEMTHIIPELTYLNEELVSLPKENGAEIGYAQAWEDRIKDLPYYQKHDVRKNAVLGYEVMMAFSQDGNENIDIDTWKKNSIKWLHDTFDKAPDGKSNVLHAVLHMDETAGPHIHAFIVPIDENGRLNARSFTGGSRTMSELQTSYAESVKETGLQRGLMGSSAEQKSIRRMYAMNNDIQKIPEVKEGESAEDYRMRVLSDMAAKFAFRKRKIDDRAVRIQRQTDQYAIEQRDAIQDELDQTKLVAFHELEKVKKDYQKTVQEKDKIKEQLERDVAEAKAQMSEYERMRNELILQMYNIRIKYDASEEEMEEAVRFHRDYKKGLDILKEEDSEAAKIVESNIAYVMDKAKEAEPEKTRHEEEYDINRNDNDRSL